MAEWDIVDGELRSSTTKDAINGIIPMNGCILLNSNGIVSHRNGRNHGFILHSPSRYGTSRHGHGHPCRNIHIS